MGDAEVSESWFVWVKPTVGPATAQIWYEEEQGKELNVLAKIKLKDGESELSLEMLADKHPVPA